MTYQYCILENSQGDDWTEIGYSETLEGALSLFRIQFPLYERIKLCNQNNQIIAIKYLPYIHLT